ncbi:hypothetical protein APHAL10511_003959 [Amanita phalloides]|nr:hypothetical protein APHAL10511_003959 [Amanita phalloides]
MATPKKSVHWGVNNSFSDIGDSLSFASTTSDHSSSTFEYVNAQLVAHGFVPTPGLSLDGISNTNAERIAKCLLDLLGQRTNDLARAEGLSTKLRVLQYDYERLQSMHRTAQNDAENAERETNLHKSRLAAANKTLQAAEAAHKQTSAELQRTRSSLQSIRTAHQTELKKKEREFERMIERWSKVADVQSKLTTVPAGITCTNAQIINGTGHQDERASFLEVALEQAEQARGQLSTENLRLKKLVLRTVNRLHGLMYGAQNPGSDDEPPELTLDDIFPLNPPDAAEERVAMAINHFEDMLLSGPALKLPSFVELQSNPRQEAEIVRLQDTINSLRREIKRLEEDSTAQLREAQNQFDQYAKKHERLMIDAECLNAQEIEKMDQVVKDLDQEKRDLADEAQQFHEKKAAFEDEKVLWETQRATIDNASLRAPVAPVSQGTSVPQRRTQRVTRKSQGKSPMKTFKVGKSNRRKAVTTTQVRESLTLAKNVIPSYETEVIPVPVPTITIISSKGRVAGNLNLSPTKSTSLLTSTFVLPPPSPEASLPQHPMDLGQPTSPPQFLAPPSLTPSNLPKLPGLPDLDASDICSSFSGTVEDNATELSLRPFPVARPLAQRMVHAYSPVKPSPLSRVLVAAGSLHNSSSDNPFVEQEHLKVQPMPLTEGDDPMSEPGHEPFPPTMEKEEEMSLAQQLGIPDSPPESLALKRKRVDSGGSNERSHQRHRASMRASQTNVKTTSKGRVLVHDTHTSSMVKGKGKASSSVLGDGTEKPATYRRSTRKVSNLAASSSKAIASNVASQVEKENKRDESRKRRSASTTTAETSKTSSSSKAIASMKGTALKQNARSQASSTNATSARSRLLAKLPPSSKGVSGPRRILVESPETTDDIVNDT